jgi:hypothetical protein
MSVGRILVLACFAAFVARSAAAQTAIAPDIPRSGSWEAGGGVIWADGFTGATRAAELTRNGELSGGFDLFTAAGTYANGAGLGGSLGYYLTPSLALEAGMRYSKPRLSFRLAGDVEDAPGVTAEETLNRYVFTGSIVWHLRRLAFAQRGVPFIIAGAGHVRDLHEGSELVETGAEYHIGGGVKYWLGAGRRRLGIRGQAGVSISDGGFDFRDEGTRTLPIVSASLVYVF